MPEIEVVTRIEATPGVVFDLELDTAVHAASLSGSGETATTSTSRPVLALGDEVTFRGRHFGLRWAMTSRVTAHDRPRRFVDEQVRGPFASMRHEHVFEAQPDGSTVMTDRFAFRAPLGPLGSVASLVLAPYLRRLLVERARFVKESAEAA
ncbi:MAG: SRPBCC family protein [Mycobacteriales bacterium]